MNRFLIFMPKGHKEIAAHFEHLHTLTDQLWAVGSKDATTADVCDRIGIGTNKVEDVVVKIDDFQGYFDKALWQRPDAWEGIDG